MTIIHAAVPCYGGTVCAALASALLELQGAGLMASHCFMSGSNIAELRAMMVEDFLQNTSATHILFVDADQAFETDVVRRMIAAGKDYVAVCGPGKQQDLDALRDAVLSGDPQWRQAGIPFVLARGGPLTEQEIAAGLFEAPNTGFGLVLLTRDMLLRMQRAYEELRFPILRPHGTGCGSVTHLFHPFVSRGTGPMGEDYSFGERWRAIGGKCHVLLDAELTHIGPRPFTANVRHSFEGSDRRARREPTKAAAE